MFTIDDVLSEQNRHDALAALRARRDGSGPDGMRLSSLDEWHAANGDMLADSIRAGEYRPDAASIFEVATKSGKRREIASINVVDRLVERMLQQQLTLHLDQLFSPSSFAYRDGKGPMAAALLARSLVAGGLPFVCEIDLKDYFTSIEHRRLEELLARHIRDESVLTLLHAFLQREVWRSGSLGRQTRGLLQGSSLSPVLSNLYLSDFDHYMDCADRKWLRFSDNICVYFPTADSASGDYPLLCDLLEWEHGVVVNQRKSGVFRATSRRLLGYDLVETDLGIEIRRHSYTRTRRHDQWHATSVYKDRDTYHLLQDGIINRKDYSLLFENEDERHHIPVEVTSQINVYSSVTVMPAALKTLCENDIRVAYVDEYGDLMGTFVPATHGKSAEVFLKQCQLYTDRNRRLAVARLLEKASIHNMNVNLQYYSRRGKLDPQTQVALLDLCEEEAQAAQSVEQLLLVEARARKSYYSAFAQILDGTDFDFTTRTRRPPKDPGNAMVSFGNTVLYNAVLKAIWRTSLDPKIGVVHATNRRSYSLNLDFADLFKPVVVDRVVFSLVNKREIRAAEHFTPRDGGVLLNAQGKRLFLEAIEDKLDDSISRNGRHVTYRNLVADEVMGFQRLVASGIEYRPYRHH